LKQEIYVMIKTSCLDTPISVSIAGTAHPRTCSKALRVAIASELHLNTAANPHDNVSANHQHNAAAKK